MPSGWTARRAALLMDSTALLPDSAALLPDSAALLLVGPITLLARPWPHCVRGPDFRNAQACSLLRA